MAELVNKDAVIRFLAGYEENLIGKRPIENGTVYFALKPDPSNSSSTVGSIYIDANGQRIIMSGDGVAIKDIKNQPILTTYIKSIEMDGSAGSKATLTYYKGSGDDVPVDMPTAGSSTAGVVTTGAQTFAGNKTFSNKVTVNGASNFEYAGIESGTSNADRVVWFAHASKKGTPVYHDDFVYNPSTKTLTVEKINGVVTKATSDGQGNNIYTTYLKDLEGTESTTNFVIKGIKGNDDTTANITIPGATTAKAGLVTTGDQTFKGKKTFQSFVYSGIAADETTNANKSLWFQSSTSGTPVYSANLTYNPSTKTLNVDNLNGTATKATGDSQGNDIYQTYLKSGELDAATDKHKLILIKGNNNEIEVPMNFVDRTGDTMSGQLVLNAGASVRTMKDSSTPTPFILTRSGSASEATSIYQNDNTLFFNMVNDEVTANMEFNMSATDTENSNGSRANSGSVKFQLASGKSTVVANNFSGLATKATGDSQGNNIYTTYLADLSSSNDGSTFSIWGLKKNSDNGPSTITINGATNTLAGLVTTGNQTFAGVKTFAGFVYSGMSESTANADRALWFMSGTAGTPTYSSHLKYNPSTKTLKVENFEGTVTKATGDGQGNEIYTTYLKDIEGSGTTTEFTIKGIKGNNDETDAVTIPAATDSKAGLITTGSQTFAGTKTFKKFRYSGIASNTALTSDQAIWFQSGTSGTPVYNADLTYNPSTKTLKATNFVGLASKATADGNGLNIRENYIKDVENTNADKHIITLVRGNDDTENVTLGFVLKSGDTMSGPLQTSFKESVAMGSYHSKQTTVPDLVEEVRYSNGAKGSIEIKTKYTSETTKEEIPTGWYNFDYTPHRVGGLNGAANSDNHNYGTLILMGMTVNAQHWRIRVTSGAIAECRRIYNYGDIVTRATGDSAGNNILDKYISEIAISEHTGNSFKFKAYDGNGNDQNEIVLPIDTSGALASLLVNGAQTLLGIKTFTDGLTVTSKEFRYTGIEVATANQARAVWFADSAEVGKPVYNTNFMYNPSTKTLTVENITGTISNAIKDQQGNTIYTFYLKDIDSETGTETFKFWGVKGNNDDGTIITVPKATTTVAGLMATTDQTFKGKKSFKNHIVLSGDSASDSQIQKAGSATSWIYGRDTAAVRITTHTTDAMYNAVTSMKTTNGDWSNGVYTSDIMYWTYTPDAKYTAKDNSGYTQMSLTKEGLLTVPSILAQTRIGIGGTNTNYTLYNSGATYFGDTLTVEGATQLNSTLGVSGAATFSDNVTVAKQITAEKIVIKDTTSKPAAGVDVPLLTVQYQNSNGTYYTTDVISAVGSGATTETNNASYRIGSHSGSLFLTAGECAKNMLTKLAGTVANTENIYLFSDGNITGYVGCSNDAATYTKAFTISSSKFNVDINLGVTGDTALSKTLTVTGTTTLKSTAYAEMDIEAKGDILATAGDLTQNVGGGIGGNGWNFWGRLRSWHPEKVIRPTSANISPRGDASLSYFLASSSMVTGKPAMDSHIIHLEWDTTAGWSGQIAIPTGTSGHMQWRTQGGSSGTTWSGNWRTVLDMYNFDEADKLETVFVHTAGDEMSGDLKLPNLEATGKITTPILIATNYTTIGGAANSNYGLYNYKTTFLADVLEVDADAKLKRLVITSTDGVKHIEFKRGSANYFTAPSSGTFNFVPNGATISAANSRLIIDKDGIRPGTTTSYNLGGSSYYWKGAYIQTLNVSANAAIEGTLTVTGKTTLNDALEVAKATTLKTTLDVTGVTTLKSTLTVKNEITAEGNIWIKNANPYVGFMEGTTTVGYLQADGDVLALGSTWSNSMKIDRTGNVTIPTGVLTVKGNQYEDSYSGALNMNNSDIYGLNSIYTADLADSSAEGIHFYRTGTTVDTIWVQNGTIYFTPNRTLGQAGTSYHILHTGNYTNHLDARYVLKSGDTMYGTLSIYTGQTGSSPGNAAIEIREVNQATNTSTHSAAYAPRLGFHWGNRYWAQIALYDNAIRVYNSDLSGYYPLRAGLITGDRGVFGYDNSSYSLSAGSFICNSWVRTNGVTGWYNETYGGGMYMEDTTWVRTYNGKSFYCSAIINAGNRIYTGWDSGVANSISCSGWFRSCNGTGWYNATYGGGIWMSDSTYVRVYGSKAFLIDNAAYGTGFWADRASGENQVGISYSGGRLYFWGNNSSGTSGIYDSNSGYVMQRQSNNKYNIWGNAVYGAVWNDYAEYRASKEDQPGRVVLEDENGVCQRATTRLQPFAGVVSDTFGFCQGETETAKTPLAVAGRVLVYPYQNRGNYKVGDCVCAAPNGTVDIMTREEVMMYPDRIVGTVSEIPKYDVWGSGNARVDGRIWIKVR